MLYYLHGKYFFVGNCAGFLFYWFLPLIKIFSFSKLKLKIN